MVINCIQSYNTKGIEKGLKACQSIANPSALSSKISSYSKRLHLIPCVVSVPDLSNIKGVKSLTIDFEKLQQAKIPNIFPLYDNGVRGITLSGRQNRKFIKCVKDAGVKTIIDLRGTDSCGEFQSICDKNGLRYRHFPIDSESISDKKMLEYLPDLFKTMDEGEFYIACAQGLHRTDIAVALNYIFNPKASQIPPKMVGHITPDCDFKQDKIFRRANGIFNALTPEDRVKLGLDDRFDQTAFIEKKKSLIRANKEYAKDFDFSRFKK